MRSDRRPLRQATPVRAALPEPLAASYGITWG